MSLSREEGEISGWPHLYTFCQGPDDPSVRPCTLTPVLGVTWTCLPHPLRCPQLAAGLRLLLGGPTGCSDSAALQEGDLLTPIPVNTLQPPYPSVQSAPC